MLLSFESRTLRSKCEDPPEGWMDAAARAALIGRLADIIAADNLTSLPVGVVWDQIAPDRVIIDVSDSCQLICRVDHVTARITQSGATDWPATTRLYVVNVELDGRAV